MDSDIRAKERTGGGLMERLRADEQPTFTSARDGACDHKNWTQVECAAAQHEHTYEPLDLLKLLAFLGVEEVRKACGGSPRYYELEGELPLPQWIGSLTRGLNGRGFGLSSLLAKLPPHRLEVDCANCRHGVVSLGPRCRLCRVSDTPAERWLLADAALACGLECAAVFDHRPDMDCPKCCGCQQDDCPIPALLAGRAWVAEPTAERLAAWEEHWAYPRGLPGWGPAYAELGEPARALRAAAHVLGEPRVREVVTAAILGRLL